PWAIIERVIKVDKKGCTGFQLTDAIGKSPSRVRNMVKNAERVAKVHGRVRERNGFCGSAVKLAACEPSQVLPRDFDRVARIDAMQSADTRCNESRPSSASTA